MLTEDSLEFEPFVLCTRDLQVLVLYNVLGPGRVERSRLLPHPPTASRKRGRSCVRRALFGDLVRSRPRRPCITRSSCKLCQSKDSEPNDNKMPGPVHTIVSSDPHDAGQWAPFQMPSGSASLIERRKRETIAPLKMDGIAPFRPKKTTELALLSAPATHVRLSTVQCAPGLVLHHCLDIRTREFFLHPEKIPEPCGLQQPAATTHAPLADSEQHNDQPARRAPLPAAPAPVPATASEGVEASVADTASGRHEPLSSGREATPCGASSSHSRSSFLSDASHAPTARSPHNKKDDASNRKRKHSAAHSAGSATVVEEQAPLSSPGTPCDVVEGVTAPHLVRPRNLLALRLPAAAAIPQVDTSSSPEEDPPQHEAAGTGKRQRVHEPFAQ